MLRLIYGFQPPALKLDKTIPLPPVSASRGASGKPELTRARLPSQHRGEDSHSSPTAGCTRTAAAATRQERPAAREAAGSPSETTQGGRASSPMKHLAGSGETTPPRAGTFSVGGDQKAERRPVAAQLEAIAAKSRSSTPGNRDPKLGQRTAAKTEVPLDLHVREVSRLPVKAVSSHTLVSFTPHYEMGLWSSPFCFPWTAERPSLSQMKSANLKRASASESSVWVRMVGEENNQKHESLSSHV